MTAGLGVTVAVVFALALEAAVGEPPPEYHPVSLFGRLIETIETEGWAKPKLVGTLLAVSLPVGAGAVVFALLSVASLFGAVAGGLLAGVVVFVTTSLRMLVDVAGDIVERSEDDPGGARERLPALVGRDTAALSPDEIRSAAVESAAENLSDGLVAPLLAFAVGAVFSLSAAAAAAAFVKAVNTMDSTFGYPGPFGWASARLDDVVMFVPARLTAVLVGIAAGDPDAPLRARRYAGNAPSPNAGWPIGTLAAALNVRLEKPGVYVLNGVPNLPSVERAAAGIVAVRRAGVAAYLLVAAFGVVLWL